MKYIKLFNTTAEYNTYTSGDYTKPNVSYCIDENKVHYNPLPSTPSHDYVEIGGLKWATMNVGAESVTDTGLYFAWGDTQGYNAAQVGSGSGQKAFAWEDYKWTNDGGSTFTKYNGSDYTVLQSEDDAVQAAWGGNWRMPTTEEFQALGTATTSAWTADYEGSGVAGLILTSKADSSKKLFFPAVGYCDNGSVDLVGKHGSYWSGSLCSDYVEYAYYLDVFSSLVSWDSDSSRYYGCPVRGVLGENS